MPGLLVASRLVIGGFVLQRKIDIHRSKLGASCSWRAPGQAEGTAVASAPPVSTIRPHPTSRVGGPHQSQIDPRFRTLTRARPEDAEEVPVSGTSSTTLPSVQTIALVVAVSIAVALGVLAYMSGVSPTDFLVKIEALVADAGPLGPAVFVAAYALATVFFIPGSVLTVAAGYLFGPLLGTGVVSAASTLGASLAFLVSRYAARPFVQSRISANPKFAQIDAGIAASGAKVVFLLRLSPLVPFTLLNYMLGLTSVPFGPYVAASWAGMLPGTVAYVGLGALGSAGLDIAGSPGGVGWPKLALYAVGVVATLWATKILSGVASQALSSDDGGDAPTS